MDKYQAACKRSHSKAHLGSEHSDVPEAQELYFEIQTTYLKLPVTDFNSLADMCAECAHCRDRQTQTTSGLGTHLTAAGTGLLQGAHQADRQEAPGQAGVTLGRRKG